MAAALTSQTLFSWLLRQGDNCLILGQQLSAWCAHAAVLEEDIALANVALDHLGQARLWLGLAADIEGAGRDEDSLAMLRDAQDFTNVLLVEQPNGNFADTVVRQFLFDAWSNLWYKSLCSSSDRQVAEVAAQVSREAAYHLRHSSNWMLRLGDGTELSHQRVQQSLNCLWGYSEELFVDDATDLAIATAGVAPLPSSVRPDWQRIVEQILLAANLEQTATAVHEDRGKLGQHSPHLSELLAEMQYMQRTYPDLKW